MLWPRPPLNNRPGHGPLRRLCFRHWSFLATLQSASMRLWPRMRPSWRAMASGLWLLWIISVKSSNVACGASVWRQTISVCLCGGRSSAFTSGSASSCTRRRGTPATRSEGRVTIKVDMGPFAFGSCRKSCQRRQDPQS